MSYVNPETGEVNTKELENFLEAMQYSSQYREVPELDDATSVWNVDNDVHSYPDGLNIKIDNQDTTIEISVSHQEGYLASVDLNQLETYYLSN